MSELRYAQRAKKISTAAAPAPPEGLISFGSGDAYPEGLPDLGEVARLAASGFRTETLQYAPRAGLAALREWIAGYVAADGVQVSPDEILVVNGAKHGLDLVCKLLLDPGDAVAVTAPTYQSALGIFRGYEATYLEVGQDGEGMRVDELRERLAARVQAGQPLPKFVYDVPDFHNPTGITTSLARRRALVEVAERFGLLVVEDDPYRRIRFEGEAVPPMASLAPSDRVVGLGTFAKLVAPGLRVGWVTGALPIVRRMAALKSDGGSCPLTQRMVLEYARSGGLEAHVREATHTYHAHRDVMMESLRRSLPALRWETPRGGYYLWVRLPAGVDADALAAAAFRRGVQVMAASHFHATPGPATHLRLCYSAASPAEITEGVRRLGAVLEEIR